MVRFDLITSPITAQRSQIEHRGGVTLPMFAVATGSGGLVEIGAAGLVALVMARSPPWSALGIDYRISGNI